MDMGKLFNGKIPEKNSRTSGVQTGIPSGETVFFIREPLKGRSFVYGSCSFFMICREYLGWIRLYKDLI